MTKTIQSLTQKSNRKCETLLTLFELELDKFSVIYYEILILSRWLLIIPAFTKQNTFYWQIKMYWNKVDINVL